MRNSRFKFYFIAGLKIRIGILSAFILLSLSLGGCAYYVKKTGERRKAPNAAYISRKTVLKRLYENYGRFEGMSGRLTISAKGGSFSFEQAGIYKYITGKYLQFAVPDMYGNILFYIKIYGTGNKAVFLNPKDGKTEMLDLGKKYTGKMLMYERLFKVFKIFLNLNNLDKIKKAGIFYNTDAGFFFKYRNKIKKAGGYYIYVNKNYLIDKITAVKHGKITEIIYFKNYILKEGSRVPLKIYVDDYLYNVKIKVALSKGSGLIGRTRQTASGQTAN